MLLNDSYGMVPGLTTSRETYENEFRWGSQFQGVFSNALLDGAARDSGNSPTHELRPGLLLGQVTSSGKWKEYSATATDGSEVAAGILVEGLRMQDFEGNNQDKHYAVLVGGPVQATKVLNLDLMARQQMSNFIFDDIGGLPGNHWFPFKRFQNKTAAYTVVAGDNYTLFDNAGAGGSITYTLPALAAGYMFGFRGVADQEFVVGSAAGNDIIAFNDAAASTITITTAGEHIGANLWFYTNAAGDAWILENHSAGANTITVA